MEFSVMCAVTAVLAVISAAAVGFCLFRGRGPSRKKLLRSVFLLGGAALACFGGGAMLACFDMGWRCAPLNAMLGLCAVLLVFMLRRCMTVLEQFEKLQLAGSLFLVLAMLMTLTWTGIYFSFFSWKDRLMPYNGQTVVCANDLHGGSGSWRYYAHINGLVHGAAIVDNRLRWGYPPPQT